MLFFAQLLLQLEHPFRVDQADCLFSFQHGFFRSQVSKTLAIVGQYPGDRLLTDAHPGTGGVEQADGFVRELAVGQVTMGQMHRRMQRFVENLHLVVRLQGGQHAAQHVDRHLRAWLFYPQHLETPFQGRVFFNVLFVFVPGGGANRAQLPAGQHRFEQVGGIAGPRLATGAHQGVNLIDKQQGRQCCGLHLIHHLAQALFKLALDPGPGLQQTDIEGQHPGLAKRIRYITGNDALGEPFDHRGLAHPRLACQQRVVLAPAHEDVDQLTHFIVTPHDRVQLAAPGLPGQVGGVALQSTGGLIRDSAFGIPGERRRLFG